MTAAAGERRLLVRARLLRNSATLIGARLITASVSLASVPIIVANLGVTTYGVWESMLAAAGLFTMFQSAISGTFLWRASQAYGAGDAAEAVRSVQWGLGAAIVLVLVVVPALWVLRGFLVGVLNVPVELREAAAIVVSVLGGLMALGVVNETLGAVITGYQRAGLASLIQAAALLLNYSIAIVGISRGWGLWSLLVGAACGYLGSLAALLVAAFCTVGRLKLVPRLPGRADLATMGRYFALLMIGVVSAVLRDHTDKVILAALGSATLAGYYGIAARLASLVFETTRFMYLPLLAAAGAMHAAGDKEGIRTAYANVMTMVSFGSGAIAVAVAALHERILTLWMGHDIPEVHLILLLLLAGNTVVVTLTGPGTSVCRGIGRVGIETNYVVVNLVLNLIFTVVLVVWMGPVGSVVSSACTWALSAAFFVMILHRRVELPVVASRRAGALLAGLPLVVLAVRWVAGHFAMPTTRGEAFSSLLFLGALALLMFTFLFAAVLLLFRERTRSV